MSSDEDKAKAEEEQDQHRGTPDRRGGTSVTATRSPPAGPRTDGIFSTLFMPLGRGLGEREGCRAVTHLT